MRNVTSHQTVARLQQLTQSGQLTQLEYKFDV
jgi:hypothetical protein